MLTNPNMDNKSTTDGVIRLVRDNVPRSSVNLILGSFVLIGQRTGEPEVLGKTGTEQQAQPLSPRQ